MTIRTGVIALLALLLAGGAVGKDKDATSAAANLKQVRAEIQKITRQMERDAAARDKLARELRESEAAVGKVRDALDGLRKQRDEAAARRAELASRKAGHQKAVAEERGALARQLRAAYLIGREEPLKLLLNQEDPARAGRAFAYYSYFGRARADRIESIETHLREIVALEEQVASEDARLAALESERRAELGRLEAARDERGTVLAKLEQESRSRAATLERLKKEQAGLEKLIRELQRALERFPSDAKGAFGSMRGKLVWPVAGKVAAQFGQTRAGGMKWDGMLLSASRSAPVHAVYHGRIAYADWLPGLGLLVIVDHGDGYLSLYGHNERLYKGVGERVVAGDTIAAVGDTGGRSRPELYFEIRKSGKPVDPRPWFKHKTPSAP